MTKKDLFEYLNGYNFVAKNEILMAICDFFRENELIDQDPSYWELAYYWELGDEYIQLKKLEYLPN